MTPLLKATYYVAIGISTLVVGFFFFANMLGPAPGDTWVHKTVMLIGGLTGFALLGWALRAGHFRGRWLAGIVLACIAPPAFALVVAAGLLMFTSVHWQ